MTKASINLDNLDEFTKTLFRKMKLLTPAIRALELYEFRYGLNNILPQKGWSAIVLMPPAEVEQMVNSRSFYDSIQIKPRVDDCIVLDGKIVELTQMLFVGLVTGDYQVEWVDRHFYFDVRGFYFLHRTHYFTDQVLAHLGYKPYRQFEMKQKKFELCQDVGYRDFKQANLETDALFMEVVQKLVDIRGVPLLLAIAGATAAGKTEIVERMHTALLKSGRNTTSIEMDNFLSDRDYREAKGIFTQGKAALHYELLKSSLAQIRQGMKISIPRYNFIDGTSSHDLDGNLKPGRIPVDVEPADIIFMEGNFPFLLEEIAHLINIKVVYHTDDPVRIKRKWKRDIDLRKKYEPTYFRNRFFKEQFIMGQIAFIPQMEICDLLVDTTGAALWTTPEIKAVIEKTSEV